MGDWEEIDEIRQLAANRRYTRRGRRGSEACRFQGGVETVEIVETDRQRVSQGKQGSCRGGSATTRVASMLAGRDEMRRRRLRLEDKRVARSEEASRPGEQGRTRLLNEQVPRRGKKKKRLDGVCSQAFLPLATEIMLLRENGGKKR